MEQKETYTRLRVAHHDSHFIQKITHSLHTTLIQHHIWIQTREINNKSLRDISPHAQTSNLQLSAKQYKIRQKL